MNRIWQCCGKPIFYFLIYLSLCLSSCAVLKENSSFDSKKLFVRTVLDSMLPSSFFIKFPVKDSLGLLHHKMLLNISLFNSYYKESNIVSEREYRKIMRKAILNNEPLPYELFKPDPMKPRLDFYEIPDPDPSWLKIVDSIVINNSEYLNEFFQDSAQIRPKYVPMFNEIRYRLWDENVGLRWPVCGCFNEGGIIGFYKGKRINDHLVFMSESQAREWEIKKELIDR